MLNGQLPLTALYLPRASFARLGRPAARIAGALGIGLICGCTSTSLSRAPVVDLSNQPAGSVAPAGGSYVVKPGDTLYQIARSNGVSVDSLKQWNNIGDANQLNVGQVLKLSASGEATGATSASTSSGSTVATPVPVGQASGAASTAGPSTTPPSSSVTPSTTTPPATTTPPPSGSATTPAESPTPTPARASDASLITWGWPSSGAVTQTFTTATKGIDIAGSLGDPVVAAADGKVMYSGNGVRGLGNLIIINHENGFITAYAHNQTLLAKTGETVKRGAKIAQIGQSDTTSPRLHFEIRRQGTPVDPLKYLPAR